MLRFTSETWRREFPMTNTHLPDPGIGRNPPYYRKTYLSGRTAVLAGAVVLAFAVAGGIYYVFNLNQIPTAADTGGVTSGTNNRR